MKPEVYDKKSRPLSAKKHHLKLGIFAAFAVIAAFLLYSAYSGNNVLTGGVIGAGSTPEELVENGIQINAELSIPEINLNNEFTKIEISGSGGILKAESQEFDLSNSGKNQITLSNYDGKLSFDNAYVSKLDGKASSVSLNGIPIKKSRGKMKVSFQDGFLYNNINIENLFINKLSYPASGTIQLDSGDTSIKVNNEEVKIENFQGALTAQSESNTLKLDGYAEKFNVLGRLDISAG